MDKSKLLPREIIEEIISYIIPDENCEAYSLHSGDTYSLHYCGAKSNTWIPRIYEDVKYEIREEYKFLEDVFGIDIRSNIQLITIHINNYKQVYTHLGNCQVKLLKIVFPGQWAQLFGTEYADTFWKHFLKNVRVIEIESIFRISLYGVDAVQELKKLLSYTPRLEKLILNGIFYECNHSIYDTMRNLPQLKTLSLVSRKIKHSESIILENITKLIVSIDATKSLHENGYKCFPNLRHIYFRDSILEEYNKYLTMPPNITFVYIKSIVTRHLQEYLSHLQKIPLVVIENIYVLDNEDISAMLEVLKSPNFIVQGISMAEYSGDGFSPFQRELPTAALQNLDTIAINKNCIELVKHLAPVCINAKHYVFCDIESEPEEIRNILREHGYEEVFDSVPNRIHLYETTGYCRRKLLFADPEEYLQLYSANCNPEIL